MDADYDDSNIYTVGYTTRNLGNYSKKLNLDYYYSNVDHPMSTKIRNSGSMTNYPYGKLIIKHLFGEKLKIFWSCWFFGYSWIRYKC